MKETFIIIGEGPTEYFFLTSLKDEFRTLQNIDPQYPKHTSMAELELKIKNAIDQGYNHVYCMIDLDNISVNGKLPQICRHIVGGYELHFFKN